MCIFMDVHYCLDQTSLNISKDTFQKTNLHFAKPSIIFVLEYVKMYHKNPCNYKLRPKSTEVQNLSRLYSRNSKKVKKSTFLISWNTSFCCYKSKKFASAHGKAFCGTKAHILHKYTYYTYNTYYKVPNKRGGGVLISSGGGGGGNLCKI